MPRRFDAVPAALLLALVLSACAAGPGASDSAGIANVAVTATDRECTLGIAQVPAGSTTFTVTNKGSKVTEVYVYAKQSGAFTKIVNEVENIGPGTSRDMTADLSAGSYEVACKPGQTGAGIRAALTVTGTAKESTPAARRYDRELEIEVTDTVFEPPAALTAKVGEKIEFKLENKGTKVRELEILDPTGAAVAEVEAEPGAVGEVIVELGRAGAWKVKVEGGGVAEREATLTVG